MRRIFGISLVFLVSLLVLTGCSKKNEKTDVKTDSKGTNLQKEVNINSSEGVINDQELDVFKFEQTSLVYENGQSVLQVLVTNTSSEAKKIDEFLIHVKDDSGNEIVTIPGYIGGKIGPKESRTITTKYGDDITKAASISYEIKK